jgi:hypothetical protein
MTSFVSMSRWSRVVKSQKAIGQSEVGPFVILHALQNFDSVSVAVSNALTKQDTNWNDGALT